VTLPPELLIHVFAMIDTDIDLAYMSLACQMLYNAGLTALNARQARSDLWTGDRLCYVGETIDADDLPKNSEPVLTDDEVVQLQLGEKHPPTAWDDEYIITLFNAADEFPRVQQLFADTVATHLQLVAPSPSAAHMLKLWSRFVRPQLSRPFKDAVLLNHTRKEYVRRQTLVERQTRRGGGDTVREFKHVRLGDVAAFWMHWTSHWQPRPSDALFSHELNRGRWAGSRISIIEAAEFRAENWTDVGVELIEDVARVYRLMYPAVRR